MKQSRKFAMTYSELAQRGDRMVALISRDINEFSEYGYTADLPTTLEGLTNTFKDIEPDMYWEGHQTLVTNAKNKNREKTTALLGEIGFKAKLALGENSKEYRMFRIGGVSRLKDSQLVTYAKHVCATAKYFIEQLASRNVDDALLAECLVVITALDDSIDDQTEAISLREQKSVERLDMGNELYEIISETSEVGKRIWENKNQAFYDDYVLYGSSKSSVTDEDEIEAELNETTE
jgi:hypothetical protein